MALKQKKSGEQEPARRLLGTKPQASPASSRKGGQIAIVIFILLAGGAGLAYIMTHKPNAKLPVQTAQTGSSDAVKKSYADQLQNNFNGAYKALDNAIANAKTNSEKASLYNEKAIAALNAGNYQLALDTAKAADIFGPSTTSAHIIAESSEQLGDKKTAVTYLKKQVDRIQHSGKPYLQDEIDSLNAKIKELGS